MRLLPTIEVLGIAIVMWGAVLWTTRRHRATAVPEVASDEPRSYRLDRGAAICAAAGVTCFLAWFVSDTPTAHWLHAASLPATTALLVSAGILSGCAAWSRAR